MKRASNQTNHINNKVIYIIISKNNITRDPFQTNDTIGT